MRKTIRFLTLLALLIAAATGARAQNATASHIIKAYTTNKTATMNEVLPYKASIIEVVSAVTGISGNVLTISGTVTNVNSSNTDVVTFGALEGWNTKFKVIAAGEAKISVTISNNANPLEFFISVIPPFNISLTSGTEDADKWTATVGTNTNAQALPVGGLNEDDAVTLTYNGRLKVKSVTATTDAELVTLATPLTIEAITAGTIMVNINGTLSSDMKYSVNGNTPTLIKTTTPIEGLTAGDKVQFYSNGTSNTAYSYDPEVNISGGTAEVKVYGNIMSLLDEERFATKTDLQNYAFFGLFAGNATLIDASELLLPAETLTTGCYFAMFKDCTSLTKAPKLPATTLADACYTYMFKGCSSLTAAPKLPATTLATSCYQEMFVDCTSLTSAYVKAAYTGENYMCSDMFDGCTADGAVLHTTPDNKARWEAKMGSGKEWPTWSVAADWQE